MTDPQAAREGRVDAVKQYLKSTYYNKRHRGAVPPIDRSVSRTHHPGVSPALEWESFYIVSVQS